MEGNQYSEIILGVITGSIFMFLIFLFFTTLYIRFRKAQFKNAREMEAMEATYKQTLLQTQLEIQEQTFQNISQEIHDNIGQVLTLAKLNLNTVPQPLPEPANDKIQRSKDLVSKAIGDLRDLSKSLNTEMIKEVGLHEAIQREISLLAKTGQHQTSLTLSGEPFRFDKQKELILFRVFQELLNNIINHAKAKTVIVRLLYQPCLFNLMVSDDGQGFETAKLEDGHFGLGIRNMQNRATLIGADFKLTSTPEKGTSVSISLPLESKNTSSV